MELRYPWKRLYYSDRWNCVFSLLQHLHLPFNRLIGMLKPAREFYRPPNERVARDIFAVGYVQHTTVGGTGGHLHRLCNDLWPVFRMIAILHDEILGVKFLRIELPQTTWPITAETIQLYDLSRPLSAANCMVDHCRDHPIIRFVSPSVSSELHGRPLQRPSNYTAGLALCQRRTAWSTTAETIQLYGWSRPLSAANCIVDHCRDHPIIRLVSPSVGGELHSRPLQRPSNYTAGLALCRRRTAWSTTTETIQLYGWSRPLSAANCMVDHCRDHPIIRLVSPSVGGELHSRPRQRPSNFVAGLALCRRRPAWSTTAETIQLYGWSRPLSAANWIVDHCGDHPIIRLVSPSVDGELYGRPRQRPSNYTAGLALCRRRTALSAAGNFTTCRAGRAGYTRN